MVRVVDALPEQRIGIEPPYTPVFVDYILWRVVSERVKPVGGTALGMSRSRLLRLLLTESGVLSLAAAAVALFAAYVGGTLLRKLLLP